ncbi:TPA: hypothetical protein SG792_004296 [Klebsiella pneumoniae]|nr:hypothetical protein [Klebsiella pneumoniae]HEH4793588.1 hypothetical protein [Klebsiella pneumoniae]
MGNFYWAICHHCDGHGSMDNPAFSDGFTNSELYDMEPEERQRIVNGAYDVRCTTCKGSGKVKVPNIREMSFGEKRALVERRREQRELDELSQMEKMERMMGS